MRSCKHTRDRLAPLLRGELPARQAAAVRTHLAGCPGCGGALDEMQATLSLLGRLAAEDEPLPSGFSASLHRALAVAGRPLPASPWARLGEWLPARPALLATAAAVVLLLAAALLLRAPGGGAAVARGPVDPVFQVPHSRVAMVRIDFVVDQAVDDVEFVVVLPSGLSFVSEGQVLPDREFRWRGRLEPGSNLVPVAVRGERAGRYVVAARVRGGEVNAEHKVVLEVTRG
jgi:hypothetical protein